MLLFRREVNACLNLQLVSSQFFLSSDESVCSIFLLPSSLGGAQQKWLLPLVVYLCCAFLNTCPGMVSVLL